VNDPQQTDISLIVPALNEGPNLRPLVEQIDAALRPTGRSYEVLIVDDNSKDETPAVAAELAKQYPVRLVVRTQPKDGLGGAVLHGMREARGGVFVVMDADLQHPPAKLPELIAPVLAGEADFVLGSRYVPGGSTGEKWGVLRKINSRLATWLARPFTGNVSDPMSGFFALSRRTFERGQRLTPLGYKIGLELMAKCRVRQVREVPIHFAERTRGQSKLTLKEQFRYLEHLSRLYDFHFPRLSPIVKFAIVTLMSWFVGFGVFALLIWGFAPGEKTTALAAAMPTSAAYLAAIAVTAVFHARYVRTQREFLVRRHPWRDFLFTSIAEWAACTLAAIYLAGRLLHPWPLELFFVPFAVALLVRYVLRKEFLLDIRGLRRDIRNDEIM
jgi:dolichol-phosphate mannosyltransferase